MAVVHIEFQDIVNSIKDRLLGEKLILGNYTRFGSLEALSEKVAFEIISDFEKSCKNGTELQYTLYLDSKLKKKILKMLITWFVHLEGCFLSSSYYRCSNQ